MAVKAGALRFNTDSNKLELYDGNQWVEIVATSPEAQTGGTRGVFHEGYIAPVRSNVLSYVNVSTTGNAVDFGDLTQGRSSTGGLSSSTRGVIGGGYLDPASQGTIDYITISSTGNAISFGSLSVTRDTPGACSNSTRGIWGGGSPGPATSNVIDYVTIASTGNAVDFGDLTVTRTGLRGSGNATRGLFFGGSPLTNVIDFITISTLGNAADFGDLTQTKVDANGCSNSTRTIIAGGYNPTPSLVQYNVIEFLTIATLGNAQDFGDLNQKRTSTDALASSTRGLFGGGYDGPSPAVRFNIIDYVTIMSAGNAIDFGDLLNTCSSGTGLSNGHGGL